MPTANVACGLTAAQLWNPVTNPTGERCGIADFMRAVFGVTVTPDAPNGKGRLAIDNVGVQYGLAALQRGEITPEQFVDLNAKVGGIDIDGNFVAAADRGRPGGAADRLRDRPRQQRHRRRAAIPEIDNRTGGQRDDTGFHPAVPLVLLPRAAGPANGDHDNQVIWLSRTGGVVPNQFDPMRQWLGHGRQAGTRDACFMAGGVEGDLTCNGTWRYYGTPRTAAGGPSRIDVVKCRLKPLARGRLRGRRSATRSGRTLEAAFPTASATTRSRASSSGRPRRAG